jgi:hypothetical protein
VKTIKFDKIRKAAKEIANLEIRKIEKIIGGIKNG